MNAITLTVFWFAGLAFTEGMMSNSKEEVGFFTWPYDLGKHISKR